MPSYFPEGNTPRPTDSFERLLQKAASLVSARNGGADAPSPDDSRERTMYKFVKGLSASISESSNLDPDALAYAVASGAADVVAIDAFVKGVKSLGLWNNMVCWPLRSRQNAGTGTVVHSLGGLGTFNGSIVNGATWGVNGIDIQSATSQSISVSSTPLTDFSNGHSAFAVFSPTGPNPPSTNTTRQFSILQGGMTVVEYGSGGTGGLTLSLAQYRIETGRRVSAFVANTTHKDLFCFYAHDAVAPEVTIESTGGSTGHGGFAAGTFSYNAALPMIINASADGSNTSAFVAIFRAGQAIASQLPTLKALYKSTLGTGLGLP